MTYFDKSFMKNWKNISPLEIKALETLNKGMNLIFLHIPNAHIIAIYLKGSFLRREMNKKSDVDVSVIVNDSKYLQTLKDLQSKYRNSMIPEFEFTGYSIEELKTGKLSNYGKKTRPGPARFTRLIPTIRLIYGEKLDLKELYSKDNLKLLQSLIKTFYNVFLPSYNNHKIGFQDLLKQCLWLFELEASLKDNEFKFTSWKELVKNFNHDHIIYRVLELRKSNEKDESIRNNFVTYLKKYLDKISKQYN